ncbi:MAG: TonB-dependent receptor, partial [Flavobacterium sp.]
MKLKLMAFLALWITIAFTFVNAQTSPTKIYGLVLDETGKTIEAATVALYSAKDSVLIKTILTDVNGNFSFTGLTSNKYQLKISVMGYNIYKTNLFDLSISSPELNLNQIKLTPVANNLTTVNVSGKKAFVEQKIDRMVVNVDALISNAGATALDVLSKSPGVNVDQNG